MSYRGVIQSRSPKGAFYARIRHKGGLYLSRGCSTALEAAREYDALAIKHHGARAKLNFAPQEKQVVLVFHAIKNDFCDTSRDVADVTGLSVDVSSAYISQLISAGALRRNGLIKRHPSGKKYHCVELT